MTTTVTQAIYEAQVRGKEQLDALSQSLGIVATQEEKLTKATTATERGFERMVGKLDPAINANQRYQATLERLARYEEAGIGTAQQRAVALSLATQKYNEQTAALERNRIANDNVAGSVTRMAAAINSVAAINQRLNVKDAFGGPERAADIAAYGQALDQLRAKYNPLFAAGQQYKATLNEINMAARQGAISELERVTAINATKAAFAGQVKAINASGNSYVLAGRRAGSFGGSMTQLSFQINDVVSGLLMGQAPFQIFAQQGGQIFQVWQMNNNVFKELKEVIIGLASRLAAALGPLGLIAIGFAAVAAAAFGLYEYLKKEAPKTEDLLKEHDRLLKVVKDSYDQVTHSASKWVEQSREATQLQLLQQQIDLQQKLNDAVGDMIKKSTSANDLGGTLLGKLFGKPGTISVKEQFAPFEDALIRLQEGFKQGAPNVREFVDEVARIALLSPALQKMGVELIKNAGDASKVAQAMKQIKEMLDLINGGKLSNNNSLGINIGKETNAYDQLIQRTKDHIDELKLEAQVTGQASDAVLKLKLQHDADRAAKKAGVPVNQQVIDQLKEELAAASRLVEIEKVRADIKYQRDTALLSSEDVAIAQQLKKIYGDDVPAALNSAEAAYIRNTNAIKAMNEAAKGFVTDFIDGLEKAKTPLEALGNALLSLEKKLASAGFDKIWSEFSSGQLFAGGTSMFGGGVTGGLFSSKADFSSVMTKSVAQGTALSLNASDYNKSGFGMGGATMAGLGAAAVIGGAYTSGQQSASPLMGGLSGALSGAMAGAMAGSIIPGIGTVVGAIGGAILGGLSGWLGGSSGQASQDEQTAQHWREMLPDVRLFRKQLRGDEGGSLTQTIDQATAKARQIQASGAGAAPGEIAALFKELHDFKIRAKQDFRETFGFIIGGMKQGFGMNSPAAQAAQQVQALGKQLREFVTDAELLGKGQGRTAKLAAQQAALSVLDTPKEMTAVQQRMMELHGAARALQRVLESTGMSSKAAAKAIKEHLEKALEDLRKQFGKDLTAKINEASGKGYLNQFIDLFSEVKKMTADAKLLGIDKTAGISKYFSAQAKSILEGANLSATALLALEKRFPKLKEVIEGLLGTMAKATKGDITAAYNAAKGRGYLNDVLAAKQQRDEWLKNADALGLNKNQIEKTYAAMVQSIIDNSGLTGKDYQTLLKAFPDLATVVHESTAAFDEMRNSITDYLDQLKLGDLSTLSPTQKLAQATSQYNNQLSLAQGGDATAQASITQYADTLLQQARAVWASSAVYSAIYDKVVAQLSGLGGLQNGGIVGMAAGGVVGNGLYGVDSVVARYAGGGSIALAGGEYVMPAAQTARYAPQLNAMRAGGFANDNGEIVAELRRTNAQLIDRLDRMEGRLAQVTAASANHVRAGIDEGNDLQLENNKRLRRAG